MPKVPEFYSINETNGTVTVTKLTTSIDKFKRSVAFGILHLNAGPLALKLYYVLQYPSYGAEPVSIPPLRILSGQRYAQPSTLDEGLTNVFL